MHVILQDPEAANPAMRQGTQQLHLRAPQVCHVLGRPWRADKTVLSLVAAVLHDAQHVSFSTGFTHLVIDLPVTHLVILVFIKLLAPVHPFLHTACLSHVRFQL